MTQDAGRNWHFHCPECGVGSIELRYLAADEEIHCEVCLHTDGRIIVLRRWLSEATAPASTTP